MNDVLRILTPGLIIVFWVLCANMFFFFWDRKYQSQTSEERLVDVFSNLKYTVYMIENISEKGFDLKKMNVDHSKEDRILFDNQIFEWENIEDISFNADKTSLDLLLKNGDKISFPDKYSSWYIFISKIPKDRFKSFDTAVVEDIYSQFSGCKICGAIAVFKDECRSCHNPVWSEKLKEEDGYENEMEYIKEQQLELFETWEEEEKINLTVEHFQTDPSWKLLVSEKEILEHSKPLWKDEK